MSKALSNAAFTITDPKTIADYELVKESRKGKETAIKELVENHGYDKNELEPLTEEQALIQLDVEKGSEIDELSQEDLDKFNKALNDDIVKKAKEFDNKSNKILAELSSLGKAMTKMKTPTQTDPGWNEYVLSHFTPEELCNGNPYVDGLRRVAQLLIGEIVENISTVNQCPTPDNGERATVTVSIATHNEATGKVKVFSGAADAYSGNVAQGFQKYPVALAETRAEGRALRKMLRLRNVAAEELHDGSEVANTIALVTPIKPVQLNMIDMLAQNNARGLNIDVEKLIVHLAKTNVLQYNSLKELSETDGQQIIKALSSFQANKGLIPVDIIGYQQDWRKSVS